MNTRIEYNDEVVSFPVDPREITGYCPTMQDLIFMEGVTLVGKHVVSVPVMKYVPWMDDYYVRAD